MGLSSDLISQFVKVTKDDKKTKKETTTYGTIVSNNGTKCVQLDGSDILTPLSSVTKTADVDVGDRVTVLIKNHTATITGNLSNPSATYIINKNNETEKVIDKITDFEIAIGEKASVKDLTAEVARVDELLAENGRIYNLEVDNVDIKKSLEARKAEIEDLQAEDVTITGKLDANAAEITSLKSQHATFESATADNFKSVNSDIYNLNTTYTNVNGRLTATEGVIDSLDANYANIDFTNIGKAAMEYLYSESGLIKNVTIGDSTITGELVGVTISGDLIKGTTVKADKLVVKGSDGLYYKLNIDAGATTTEEVTDDDLQNGLHGSAIIAKTITATQISVSDLVAFDATIGGFNITNNALYSGVKESATNTTRGIYLDNEGQLAVGDSSNYLRYYKDSSGNYKLEISAVDNLENRVSTVEQTANGLTVKLDGLEVGGRNYILNSDSHTDTVVYSSADGITWGYSTAGEMVVTAKPENGNWMSWYHPNVIETNFKTGDEFTFSMEIKMDVGSYGKPTMYFKDGLAGGYYALIGEVTTEYSTLYCTGIWNDSTNIQFHLGWSGASGIFYIRKLKFERGNKPTDWSPAPEDVDSKCDSAAKTATNYLDFSTSGLVVGDMTASTLGKNVLIDSDSVDIRNNTTTLASFGADTIYLGKNSEKAVINLCNGSATMTSVDDYDFKIYTDKRLVMSAYSSALLDCWRDSTHMTRISMQSADPDATYMHGGIFCTIYQDTIKNTFDMSGNTTEFKITDGTNETLMHMEENAFKLDVSGKIRLNAKTGIQIADSNDYEAKVTLGNNFLVDKSINWYWSDNAVHDGIGNYNGQITYFGPGDIGEATTTNLRGKYVRLYAHEGGAVYLGASGSTAVTSDRNLKTDILDIDNKYIDFFDRLRPITYKYNKGHRDHIGFIAQEVEEALIASGLTTEEFAGLIIEKDVTLNPNYDSSMTDEEIKANETHYDTLYSLRYEEFISLLVKKVQSLQEQINQLKETL